jgi:hypothetical protein
LEPFTDPVLLLVSGLAVYRLTRLLVADKITERPRDRLAQAARGRLAYFVTCPWCVSVWVAAGWAALVALAPAVALVAGAVLAWSAVAGLLASWE